MSSLSMTTPEGTWCDPGFRGLIYVSFGKIGSVAVGIDQGVQQRHVVHFDSADTETLAQLRSIIKLACVGVRLVLIGPLSDLQAASAVAAECGLVDEEVTLVPDESERRKVYCAHCRTVTVTYEPLGSELECEGCATVLSISNHFSRRIAAYLGFAAHAEEAA